MSGGTLPVVADDGTQGRCFVISPFGGYFDLYYRDVYRPAVLEAGLEAVRADDLFRASNILSDVWRLIRESRVLLADVTGKNPNVFYELGLAHAARKPVVIVTADIADVPFDLQPLRVLVYDVRQPTWGETLQASITTALRETLASPEQQVLPTFLYDPPGPEPATRQAPDPTVVELRADVESLAAEVRTLRNVAPVVLPRASAHPTSLTEAQVRQFVRSQLASGRGILDIAADVEEFSGLPPSAMGYLLADEEHLHRRRGDG